MIRHRRIVIIGNNSSGMYDFRHELIEELKHQGCAITVLTPFDHKVNDLEQLGIHMVNTPVDRRGIDPVKDLCLLFLYLKLLRELQPDLVITYTIKPNIYGGIVCRFMKIPYAANITGLGTGFQKEGTLKRLVIMLYQAGLQRAGTVFFENEEDEQIFIDAGIVETDHACLLNGAGVNLERFQVAAYPEDSRTRFLFIGRVMREKGINELFAAMR